MSHPHDCTRCGRCVEWCPMNWKNSSDSPMSYCMDIRYEKTSEENLAESTSNCNACGLCNLICPQKIPVKDQILKNREVRPGEVSVTLPELAKKKEKTLFFTGCYGKQEKWKDLIDKSVKYLEKCGEKIEVDSEICCGAPLLYSGNKIEFKKYAQELYTHLRKYKKIITFCPECHHFLYDLYYDYFCLCLDEVQSLLQYWLNRDEEIIISSEDYLHFPCREINFPDNPLDKIIQKKLTSENLRHSNLLFSGQAVCCGSDCFSLNKTSENSVWPMEQWIDQRVKRIITFCPHCQDTMVQYQSTREVKHFADIMDSFPDSDSEPST